MKITIEDVVEEKREPLQKDPLPEEFGRNLDTVERARKWLTNPHNWFEGRVFILRWEGLVPKISSYHGQRLAHEVWDNGIPWVVVREQLRLKRGGRHDPETQEGEEV